MLNRTVVIDTNVLVSAGIRAGSNPGKIVLAVLQAEIVPVVCPGILEEYVGVFRRAKFARFQFPPQWFALLLKRSVHLQVDPRIVAHRGVPDPDDLLFLEVARLQGACLITGNVRDFPTAIRRGVSVSTPANYLLWLDAARGS